MVLRFRSIKSLPTPKTTRYHPRSSAARWSGEWSPGRSPRAAHHASAGGVRSSRDRGVGGVGCFVQDLRKSPWLAFLPAFPVPFSWAGWFLLALVLGSLDPFHPFPVRSPHSSAGVLRKRVGLPLAGMAFFWDSVDFLLCLSLCHPKCHLAETSQNALNSPINVHQWWLCSRKLVF